MKDPLIELIERELTVDAVYDDVTVRAVYGSRVAIRSKTVTAEIRAKEAGVFSGENICRAFNEILRNDLTIDCLAREGARFESGEAVVRFRGPLHLCLGIERTLLNLLCHVCGVATLTAKYVNAVRPHRTKVLATRKTLPGLRGVELDAVKAGGGHIHRRSLSDGILIKENHLAFASVAEALTRALSVRSPLHGVEIEVQNLNILEQVLAQKPLPHVVMLDNFGLHDLETAIAMIASRCQIEVSGGVTLETISAIAALNVDYISVGRLTHSAASVDLSVDFVEGVSQSNGV